jgi:bacteriocin-like protein
MKEKIQEAIEKLNKHPELQENFKANPRQTLADLGLDPEKVKLVKPGTTEVISDKELASVSGGVGICAKHGGFDKFESTAGL